MRIEPAIAVHAGVEQQADLRAVGENPLDEIPTGLRELVLALLVPEQVLAFASYGDVRVHAVAVHAGHRLRQEARGHIHPRGDLARQQLVQLHLVGRGHNFAIAVINFKL